MEKSAFYYQMMHARMVESLFSWAILEGCSPSFINRMADELIEVVKKEEEKEEKRKESLR